MVRGWRFPGLTLKLLVALVGITALISAAQGFLSTRQHQQDLEQMVMQAADRNADVVRRSARSAMLKNNRDELHEIMDAIGSEPGIVRLRIFSLDGRIRYSTDRSERDRRLDMKSPECKPCHASGSPARALSAKERLRIFRDASGGRVLGVVLPIPNEAECYQAECHAHPAKAKVLGVLDVNITLTDVDRFLKEAGRRQTIAVAVTVVVVSFVVVTFILIWVNRPLRHLMEGTRRVAAGELNHVIPVTSRDEMGQFAETFNDMTRRLKESMQVIQHWNETLQRRVDEKTEELKQTQRHLLRVERMATLGKLAAIIAHEINNPLAGIRTYAKLLKKRSEKPDRAYTEEDGRQLGFIESEAARCGDIVKGLLEFSRKAPIRLARHHISRLTEEALRLVQHRLDMQGIEVRKDLQEDLPEISCSAQQVVQGLLAVLINACEAIVGEGAIEVATGAEADGSGVWVSVHDTGVGMDESTLEHIFEPFFSTKESASGVGLGLAVVYGIVQGHGGNIDVQSKPREGTTFTLRFPLEPPAGLAADMLKEDGL